MNLQIRNFATTLLALCTVMAGIIPVALAQTNGSGNNGNSNNNSNRNNNRNSAGIHIDADGLMTAVLPTDSGAGLDHKRRAALARQQEGGDWTHASSCRKVSLNRLEKAWQETRRQGNPRATELLQIAGLQRIDFLFVLPESGDLVIAGPAEGCVPDATGRMVGVESGRPALNLEDFTVIWQSLSEGRFVGCSIDPDPARLAQLQQFLAVHSGAATINRVEQRFRMMPDILGPQQVNVKGVPADSHVASVLVEADWRMKRISIGLENPRVKGLRSHLEMLSTAGGNSMQRWYFIPLYEELVRSGDGLSYSILGQRAQLVSQEELADMNGNRSAAPTTRMSTKAFAKQFTSRFPDLAAKSPVFAELQNIIDWTLVAALIRRENLGQKIGWTAPVFSDPVQSDYPRGPVPRAVASLVNAKRSGNIVIGLVGGGVNIGSGHLAESEAWTTERGDRLPDERTATLSASRSDQHPWWWD